MDKENNSKTIYLDNAATTFPKPESVYTEMDYVNRNLAVNTGRGSYSLARKATEIIDRTREKALKLVKGKDVADIVLTPSATIAMNVIIGGLDWSGADVCYVSPFEHNAVMRPLHLISEKYGFDLIELPLKSETLEIDFEKMEYMFSMNPPTKVFATHISNVTGYILPVKEITEMAKKYNATDFAGSNYVFEDGRFNGTVIPMWDSTSKNLAIDNFVEKYNIDLSKSYAYGDTNGDITMLRRVGNPIAINPTSELVNHMSKDKELKEMRDSLAVGDTVVTIGGIVANVAKIEEETIVIEFGPSRTKMPIQKWAIGSVQSKKESK